MKTERFYILSINMRKIEGKGRGIDVNLNLFGLPILASYSCGYYVTSNWIISINDRG